MFGFPPEMIEGCLGATTADDLFRRARRGGLAALPREQRRGLLPPTTGAVAEAVAAVILGELGFSLVWQITTPGVTGVDLVVLTPGEDALIAVEVKGTLRTGHLPRLARSRDGQMTGRWLEADGNPGMAEWGLAPDDLYGAVMIIDLAAAQWLAALTRDFAAWSPVRAPGQLAWPKGFLRDGHVDYQAVAAAVSASPERLPALAEEISDAWATQYRLQTAGDTELVEVTLGALMYLFDIAGERLVGAYGTSQPRAEPRPDARMRGHPSSNRASGPQIDRGHVIGHALGGGTDINLVLQLHSLNIGGEWRSFERYARDHPGTFLLVQLEYADESQYPATFTYGIVRSGHLDHHVFDNRPNR